MSASKTDIRQTDTSPLDSRAMASTVHDSSRVSWQQLRDEIYTEALSHWSEEPVEVTQLRSGIVHAGAGSFGQYYSTLVFALVYTLALGEHMVYALVREGHRGEVPLPTLKRMTKADLGEGFKSPQFLGYVLAPNVEAYGERILDVLPEIESYEDYTELIGAYFTYLNILHWWLHVAFPWYLGEGFPQVTPERVTELASLGSAVGIGPSA
jgi:hypothetical protein